MTRLSRCYLRKSNRTRDLIKEPIKGRAYQDVHLFMYEIVKDNVYFKMDLSLKTSSCMLRRRDLVSGGEVDNGGKNIIKVCVTYLYKIVNESIKFKRYFKNLFTEKPHVYINAPINVM